MQSSANKLRKDARGFPQRDRVGCLQWASTVLFSLIAGGCPKGNRVGYVTIQNILFLIYQQDIDILFHDTTSLTYIFTLLPNHNRRDELFLCFHDGFPPP